ncbi:hypothetical protein BDP27DRAFT_1334474 [Rhodocollybia butyracea]|uniref:Uncharacterized protein n=1 Tax=Rhodocollybia butyracea TaxID=206335 RepID=A0A9P5PJM0_9AGAR|nr:hypothetical protein BDP27DRAFT_1334474 [Rhodocollybia butyracea]
MKFSHRFKNVYLSLPSSVLSIFGQLAPPMFPILASLQLRDSDDANLARAQRNAAANFALLGLLFPRAPSLHRISLQLVFGDNMLPCNWKHLTSLTVSSPMLADLTLNALAQVPQMRALDLMINIFQDVPPWKDRATVYLNNLSILRLSLVPARRVPGQIDFETNILSMFHCIHCPALQSFSFSCPKMILISKLIFVSLPLDMLEELELEMTTTPEVLTECLLLIPNLTSFKFTDSTYRP